MQPRTGILPHHSPYIHSLCMLAFWVTSCCFKSGMYVLGIIHCADFLFQNFEHSTGCVHFATASSYYMFFLSSASLHYPPVTLHMGYMSGWQGWDRDAGTINICMPWVWEKASLNGGRIHRRTRSLFYLFLILIKIICKPYWPGESVGVFCLHDTVLS